MSRPKRRIFIQEHHLLLVFAWRVMQGIKNNTPIKLMKKYVAYFYQHCLLIHCLWEEKLLEKALEWDERIWQDMISGHEQLQKQMENVMSQPETDYEDLQVLCHQIIEAVRFEEQKLLPYLRSKLLPYQFSEMEYKLENSHPGVKDDFSPAFWV